jgi:hypothetical protein
MWSWWAGRRSQAGPVASVLGIGLGLVLLSGLGGCASSYSFGEAYDGSIKTVGVRMFDNQTFDVGAEAKLTEAVSKQIQRRTPWKIVAPERADAVLSGVITGWELDAISVDSTTGLAEEQGLRLEASFEWRDGRTGERLVARDRFSSVGTFVPAQGVGERIEVGRRDAVEELARGIVETLRSDW